MASSFVLTLDTHAPQLTWGAVAGTVAGEVLRVGYTVNEPGVDSAVLSLADGRALAMAVLADHLEVALPADAPAGNATLTAVAIDDVGNRAVYTLAVALTGTIITPEPSPAAPPSRPAQIAPRPRKFVTSRSRLRGSCPAEVQRGIATSRTAAGTGSRATTRARATASSPLKVDSSARATVFVTARDVTSARAAVSNVAPRRRDGRGLEEALLLDLL